MKRLLSLVLALALLVSLAAMGNFSVSAASEMKASEQMIEILMKLEGWSEKPYWDNSQYSVGYGTRPLSQADLERYMKEGISKEESRRLLDHYLEKMGQELNAFNDKHSLNFTQGQFDALLSLTYNCGTSWMYQQSTLVSTLLAKKTGNELLFAIGQWSTSGGVTSRGHVRRRLIECNMYLNGAYSMTVPENFQYVVYNNNGGTADIKVQCFDANTPVELYSVPTMEGHTFLGWYTQEVGGEKITQLGGNMGNPTIYAHWANAAGEEVDPGGNTGAGGNTSGTRVTVTATDVNLRKGPGTGYGLQGKANMGDILYISDVAQGGSYLWGNTGKGWIALKYTNYTAPQPEENTPPVTTPAPTEPPVTTPAPTEPPVTTPAPTEPPKTESVNVAITVTANDVNLRKGPGTGYELTGKANKGDKFTVTEIAKGGNYTWGKTNKGWIALTYTDYGKAPSDNDQDPPAQQKLTGTVTGSNLRIRKGPSTGYAIVGYYQTGDRVVILEKKTAGSMVWGKTDKGWISMDYVKLDSAQQDKPTEQPPATTPPATTPPQDQPAQPSKITGTITGSNLRIRSGAGIKYAIRGYLQKGDKVEILEKKDVNGVTWGRIDKGWISMDYVKLNTSTDTGTALTGKVTSTARLRVRSGPHTTYPIVGYLAPNASVKIYETKTIGSAKWGRVDKGWVLMDYIILDGQTEEKPEAAVIQGAVTATALYVRQTPGMTGKIVGRLLQGTKVEILQTRKVGAMTWGQTSQGWVSMDYIKQK